jgi:hypothetical protein
VQRLAVARIIQSIANDPHIVDELERRQTGAALREFDGWIGTPGHRVGSIGGISQFARGLVGTEQALAKCDEPRNERWTAMNTLPSVSSS